MADSVRVLLIDDEADFLESISYWLTSKGYEVRKASSGEQGLAILKEHKPDIVFLDVMMPEMDGIETLRRIRAIDKALPVVLVTASNLTDENKYAGAKALGISGLFPKGTSLTQLGEVLQVALRRLRKSGAPSSAPSGEAAPASGGGILASLRKALGRFTPPPH